MGIKDLIHTDKEYNGVVGLDISTTALAFGFLTKESDWSLSLWGKIDIDGKDMFYKCSDVYKKFYALCGSLYPDMIVIESSVYVNNNNVMKSLSMIMGSVGAASASRGVEVREVPPITWQSFIGNKSFTKEQKEEFSLLHPGMSESQIKSAIREERKKRTIQFVESKFGQLIEDNDVTDAISVAYYGAKNFVGSE